MQPSDGGGGGGGGDNGGGAHVIAQGLKVGGSLLKGVAGYEQGKFNRRVAQFNQRVALDDNVAQQQQVRDAARAAMGEQIARQGGSGLELGTGSALDAIHESALNAQLDALELRRKGAIQKTGYDNDIWSAKATGQMAFEGGVIDAATAAFTGGADYAAAGA